MDHLNKKKILITGSSGFIGNELSKYLYECGSYIWGLDLIKNNNNYFKKHYDTDLTDNIELHNLVNEIKDVDIVFHLAAAKSDWGIPYDEYYKNNYIATENILDLCKKTKPEILVYFSTVGILGSSKIPLKEDELPNPDTDYGKTKLISEEIVRKFASNNSFTKVIIIRPSAVYGEGQTKDNNIDRIISSIRKNRFLMIGKGDNIKTTSYIKNLIDMTIWSLDNSKSNCEIWHYIDEPKLTTKQLINICYKEIHNKQQMVQIPFMVAYVIASLFDLSGRLLNINFSITAMRIKKFCTATNFSSDKLIKNKFKHKYNTEDALKRTIKWHFDNEK